MYMYGHNLSFEHNIVSWVEVNYSIIIVARIWKVIIIHSNCYNNPCTCAPRVKKIWIVYNKNVCMESGGH